MNLKALWLLPLMALALFGCGGGSSGSGGTGGGTGGGAMTPFYATDAPSVNFHNVWVTVYQVNLVTNTNTSVPVFTSTAGVTIDVRHLHDATGQLFELLDASNIPAGTYTGVRVDLGNSVTILKEGGTVSTTYQFAASNSGGTGFTQLAGNFNPTYVANGSTPVVIDFDLTNWSINNQNQVVASITTSAENVTRQVDRPIKGTIQNLAGSLGAQSFSLIHDKNGILDVTTTSTTSITNEDGSDNPVLSNGEKVFVQGTFTNDMFVASSITILPSNGGPTNTVHLDGAFSNANATAGTFTLTVNDSDDSLQSDQVTVDTNTNTDYFADGVTETQADFFSQLGLNPTATVEVTGTIAGTIVTATRVEIEVSENGQTQLVSLQGMTSSANATAGTFGLTVSGWQDCDEHQGNTVSVVTNSSTYYNLSGNQATEADWFAALNSNTQVVVIGTLSNGVLTADALVIGGDNDGLGHGHHKGNGNGNGNGNG